MPDARGNLLQGISDLLIRITEGRSRVPEVQRALETCEDAKERQDAAEFSLNELVREAAYPETSLERFKRQLKRAQKRVETRRSEFLKCWHASGEATDSYDAFKGDVTLFAERLPLTSEFMPYRDVIRTACHDLHLSAWVDPQKNHVLDTLALRLQELRALVKNPAHAVAVARPKGRPTDHEGNQVRTRVRKIWRKATHEGSKLTHRELCERLDAGEISLPSRATWATCRTWVTAFDEHRGCVDRWLSERRREF
jgi:hypothetical protein